ncbi:DUF4007 family protein [Psychrobacillus sp. FJAT-21963]|uniref:DUF4007 family protein n=1 Tax=Psychrobacillus sp. FJAT-21963 TaxID=1712028 RepID=UPI0006F53F62|nr:DUF4007 family protein [Psychrobacillus sp. FJAT-21963]KQL35265.1 hypothetical protein AN959_10025 [Psychrobacillus sp. FJAT-21963]
MAYGRHESFYLRNKWISKGLKHVRNNNNFFYDKDNFEKIGLGKNMVRSLRFWLTALNLIEENNKKHTLTPLGEIIFKQDRLLEKPSTIAILHSELLLNKGDTATVFNWFFTQYSETITTKKELKAAFKVWVNKKEAKIVAEKSLDRDIDVLIQLYTKEANESDPEDTIFSPFTALHLMKEERSGEKSDTIRKNSIQYDSEDLTAFYYTLIRYAQKEKVEHIQLDEIMSHDTLWGKIFNLSKTEAIDILNNLTSHEEYPIEYVRTNNLDNVKIPQINELQFLESQLPID